MKYKSTKRTQSQIGRQLFSPARGLVISLFVSAFFSITAEAQQRIVGTVTNKNTGDPVAAMVKVESDILSVERAMTTDKDGRFVFAGLSPGSYTVSASAGNFLAESVTLVLGPRAASQIVFELNPTATLKEQMTVQAESKLLDETQAATTYTIGREQI